MMLMIGSTAATLHNVNSKLETATPEQKQQFFNQMANNAATEKPQIKETPTKPPGKNQPQSFSDKLNNLKSEFGDLL
jgi:hypothetical protein